MENNWTTVRRRRKPVNKQETTYFVTNLPKEAAKGELWKAFEKYGNLSDVYMAAAKNNGMWTGCSLRDHRSYANVVRPEYTSSAHPPWATASGTHPAPPGPDHSQLVEEMFACW
ncbi:unnamed protein product [Lactuca saligna]|uniref:RRM domain-containing protein n=1 Tax=Lactuca saligna TaxID=75948 RepID=A0AA35VII3_LACSI|nr:unnamed protein product [Lactuca saligna]